MWFYSRGVSNILFQFRMVVFSKWRVTHDIYKYHRSGNVDDLGHEVTTSSGFNCRFTPTKQGLCVHKTKDRSSKNMFGKDTLDNVTIFWVLCHALIEYEDGPDTNVSGVNNVEAESGANQDNAGVIDINSQSEPIEVEGMDATNKRKVTCNEAIETIRGSRDTFSNRDQLRADRVRRLQYVSGFPSDQTITYLVLTNGVRNNPSSKRDVDMCDDTLCKIRYAPKGKRTMI